MAEGDEAEEEAEDDVAEEEAELAVEHADDDEVLRLASARTEAFDAEMKERLRAGVDRFEEMVAHEEGIRLGDAGWKERYYKVQGCAEALAALLVIAGGFSACCSECWGLQK